MTIKATLLTIDEFDQLSLNPNWELTDIPPENWNKIPGIERLKDTFAMMGSACPSDPHILNKLSSIAGIDVLTLESNPKVGEPEGNAYHYVFQLTNDPKYPYKMYGPFKLETRVPHWFEVKDLDNYKKVDFD